MGELLSSVWEGFAAAEARRAAMTQEERDAEDAAEAAAAEARHAKFLASPSGQAMLKQQAAAKILQPAIDGLFQACPDIWATEFSLQENARFGGDVAGIACVASTYDEGWDMPTTEIGATQDEFIIVLNSGERRQKILRAPRPQQD